ncbi:RDD family protein [Nocardioides sp. DS6]|uniref:RDD family protein n=1 Tax=Nocardioides eburneus TaxID=3231482 RepID=A0ABV3T148_9ACTN
MSHYGTPPDPFSTPAQNQPYGAPPPPPPGYGTPPGYPAPPVAAGRYAHWGQRLGAFLIDGLLGAIAAAPVWIGEIMIAAGQKTETMDFGGGETYEYSYVPDGVRHAALALILLGVLTSLAFGVWNIMLKQGRTGYSIGKGVLGIKLVKESTGRPVGPWLALGRQILHILDELPCYLGFLWPLWDQKRQTFADKVVGTVVIVEKK